MGTTDEGGGSVSRAELRDLVGIAQFQDMLAPTTRTGERPNRNYADKLASSKGFPDPVVIHPAPPANPQIRLWLRREVEVWLDRYRPGWRDS